MTISNPPFIPENAPFSAEQRSWLNGFLAGMYSSQGEVGTNESDLSERKQVTILWGSQTGNSEGLAKKVAKTLKAIGCAPTVVDMGEYDASKLKDEESLLIITSTYGEGEPPDNAARFHAWLMNGEAPKLDSLRYSVLALGDTNYPDFCKCGIEFDARLKDLGATPITPRVDCDVDYEDPFMGWLSAVETSLGNGSEPKESEKVAVSETIRYGKKNPFPAKLISNDNLNGEGSAKHTRHVAFSLEGSGLSYEAGDALAVLPVNDSGYVAELMAAAELDKAEMVAVPGCDEPVILEVALTQYMNVTSLTSKIVKAYATLSGNERVKALAADRTAFKEYVWGREFIDLILEEPYRFSSGQELVDLLPKLSPRLYSISSSPRKHENEVQLTVGVVRYKTHGRNRKGVCSNYLAELDGSSETRIYFHHTKSFKLPQDGNVPIIMVGPGTGIAPFRAFLEERLTTGAKGDSWLIFGDQHEATDFLYQNQLESYLEDGTLDRLDTAWSRDQAEKVYVQDRMRENGAELYSWLEKGARFYVCGDASRMAKDVDAALCELIAEHGKRSEEDAKAYVDSLKKEKRYLRDVY